MNFSAQVQIFLTLSMPWWLYFIVLLITPNILNALVNYILNRKKPNKQTTNLWILNVTITGTFIIALALGSNSGVKFGNLPSTISLFNPMIGFIPIYIAYLLERAILQKRIK